MTVHATVTSEAMPETLMNKGLVTKQEALGRANGMMYLSQSYLQAGNRGPWGIVCKVSTQVGSGGKGGVMKTDDPQPRE